MEIIQEEFELINNKVHPCDCRGMFNAFSNWEKFFLDLGIDNPREQEVLPYAIIEGNAEIFLNRPSIKIVCRNGQPVNGSSKKETWYLTPIVDDYDGFVTLCLTSKVSVISQLGILIS